METVFHLNARELDEKFLEGLKKLFEDKNIIISVEEIVDTTDYLLSDPERKERLFKSTEEAKNGELIAVNLDDYKLA